MSETPNSIYKKKFLFDLEFQYLLIFIFTFSLILRFSYGFFINGDLYVWSYGTVNQGLMRTTSRIIENIFHSKYSFLNSYLFSSIFFALGITLNTFLGLNLFKKISGSVYFSILYLISIRFSPAGFQIFHNIHTVNSWEQYFFSLFAPLCLLYSDYISEFKNPKKLIYYSFAITIIILGIFYREFTFIEMFSLLLILSLTTKTKIDKYIFSSLTIFSALIAYFSLYSPANIVTRAIIDFTNISQIFIQQTDLYFITSFILGLLIISLYLFKKNKSLLLFFLPIFLLSTIFSILRFSTLLIFIFIGLKIVSSLLIKNYRKITFYSILTILLSLYGLSTIRSSSGHFLHLLIPLFVLDSIQINFLLKDKMSKFKNLIFFILTFNAFIIFSLSINGFIQTSKVLNVINQVSNKLGHISEDLIKENIDNSNDQKVFPLYGNPYYLNDIGIKSKSFDSQRCSNNFLSKRNQDKGVLLIHDPSFDCSIFKNNLSEYKKISSFSFDINHFLPGYFFANLYSYKYSGYTPDEWVTTFPLDLRKNKNIVKYKLDIYLPKD